MRPATRRQRALSVWLLVALGGFLLLRVVAPADVGRQTISYTRFLELVDGDRVEEVAIGETEIEGVYLEGRTQTTFRTTRPPEIEDAELLDTLVEHDVDVSGERPGLLQNLLLSWVLPLLLLAVVWIVLSRRFSRGAGPVMSFGKSKHKVVDRSDLKTTFADVAGVDEALEELREIVDFLRRPDAYRRIGAKLPKGILLVGPPGTGKTLLARAVAGEANVPFFFIAASEFVELFVGLGAARVRDLFQQAKQNAPCMIFIDELDTIGRSRGSGAGGLNAHEEREQTLNQLLTEMDGFDPSAGVLIVAATNRPDVLDPALRRPGRFDRQVVVDLPDRNGRVAILRVHARGVRLGADAVLETVAARTPGASGAELENIVNEAALLASRRGKELVGQSELEEAVDRVSLGLERRSRVLRPDERERVAYHELGHALVALARPHADPVHRVSIVPRGAAALGVTQQLPADDRYIVTRAELEDRLAVTMGGRAAEKLVYGDTSTGAASDLQQATGLARRMVQEFGMSDGVGPVALARQPLPLPPASGELISERVAAAADDEVRALLEEALHRAEAILREQRDKLPGLTELLLARETLTGDELVAALVEPPRAALRGL